MKGAIAAGHPLTAEAGAAVLREGGNAVDACIAAAFVSWVAESPLTGPGGGGFMLVYRARDRTATPARLLRLAPRRGLGPASARAWRTSTSTSTAARTRSSTSAPPRRRARHARSGSRPSHRRYGSRPWAALLDPAIELARAGVELTRQQAYLHAMLDLILRHTAEGREIYGPAASGSSPATGS